MTSSWVQKWGCSNGPRGRHARCLAGMFLRRRAKSRDKMTLWRHQMRPFRRFWPFVRAVFSALLALCETNHRLPVDFPHKDKRRVPLMFSFIYAWTNGWGNTPDASDLRPHRAHYICTYGAALYCTMTRTLWFRHITLTSHEPQCVLNHHKSAVCGKICITTPNGNIFRVIGPLWGKSTGHRGALMFSLMCAWNGS